jgi:hypothetical protein
MTTFTTEDRKTAYDPGLGCVIPNTAGDDLVAAAPYHPGYEGAGLEEIRNPIMDEVNEYRAYKARHLKTAKGIVNFIRGPRC